MAGVSSTLPSHAVLETRVRPRVQLQGNQCKLKVERVTMGMIDQCCRHGSKGKRIEFDCKYISLMMEAMGETPDQGDYRSAVVGVK